jgi:hypothetical protein
VWIGLPFCSAEATGNLFRDEQSEFLRGRAKRYKREILALLVAEQISCGFRATVNRD